MVQTYTKAVRQLAIDLSGAQYGLVTPGQVATLARLAKRYANIQLGWCNGPGTGEDWSDAQRAARERSEARLEARIAALAGALPVVERVTFSGDPRGCCVHLHRRDGRYNTWGGKEEGWGI